MKTCGLSADIIAQVCTLLPAGRTQVIQERAAYYTNDIERAYRHRYCSGGQRLLRYIPSGQLTARTRARQEELNRKFPPRCLPRSSTAARRSSRIQSRSAYSADTNTTTAAARSHR